MKYLKLYLYMCCILNVNSMYAQKCNCDSIIKKYQLNWKHWIVNADTIFILKAKSVYTINSEANKQEAVKRLINAKWAANIVSGKTVTIHLEKLDTLYGKTFDDTLQNGSINSRSYESKKKVKKVYEEQISIGDIYYEIYFQFGKKIIISPSICQKKYCVITGNILSNFIITR